MTPAGLVSLHGLNESNPILGPSHTNQRHPRLAHFIGDVTTKNDPIGYIASIHSLVQAYRAVLGGGGGGVRPPLVVNCDGWVKGMGSEVLGALIQVVKPTHILRIQGTSKSKKFEMPSPIDPLSVGSFQQQLLFNFNFSFDVDEDHAAMSAAGTAAAVAGAGGAADGGGDGGDGGGGGGGEGGDGASGVDVSTFGGAALRELTSWDFVSAEDAASGGGSGSGTRGSAPVAADLRIVRLASYFRGGVVTTSPMPSPTLPPTPTPTPTPASSTPSSLALAPSLTAALASATVRNGALSDAQCSVAGALQAQTPYTVPFHAVSLVTLDAVALSPYELLRAFNGCVAALVVDEPSGGGGGGGNDAPAPAPAPSASAGRCLGLCIVRSIDVAAQRLFVLTPVPLADLRRVTTLVRPAAGSGITVPLALSYHPDAPAFPYLHCESVVGASNTMKSRNNIQRH